MRSAMRSAMGSASIWLFSFFFLFAVISLSFPGTGKVFASEPGDESTTSPAAQTIESVVAVVNDSLITKSQLDDKIRREMYLRGVITFNPSSSLRRRILDELIDDELLVQEARKKEIEPPAEIIDNFADKFVSHVRNLFPDEKTFRRHIDANYIDLVDFEKRARKWEECDYLINALISLRFSIFEEDVEAYRQKLRSEGKPAVRYRLSQLFLRFPEGASEADKQNVEERALDILVKIHSGADFTRMVKQYSEDEATRRHGGDLGVVEEGRFAKTIEDVVKHLDEGGVSTPIRTERGVHLIRLDERQDTRSLLFRRRFSQERKKLLDDLRKNAHIRILEKNL